MALIIVITMKHCSTEKTPETQRSLMTCTSSLFYCKHSFVNAQRKERWKLECYKKRMEKRHIEEEGRQEVMWSMFIRAVNNNTFLQLSQQRKKSEIETEKGREKERGRETTARTTERKRKQRQGWTQVRACNPLQWLSIKTLLLGKSMLISYIDTYPLCDFIISWVPSILCVVSRTHRWSKMSWRNGGHCRVMWKGRTSSHRFRNPVTLLWLLITQIKSPSFIFFSF